MRYQVRLLLLATSLLISNYNIISVDAAVAVKIGARPSPLAQTQARAVAEALGSFATTAIVAIKSTGDQVGPVAGTQAVPLAVAGGGAADFTSTLDEALLAHEIDAAVHSLKDIPPTGRWREGLYIACHLPREDPHDVLVGPHASISELPQQARVGTSSVRRQAQLLALRPDLDLINLRGNVEVRLGALGDEKIDALLLAQAGLNRLLNNLQQSQSSGTTAKTTPLLAQQWNTIPTTDMLSAACQGIVVVVCRAKDKEIIDCLAKINDRDASVAAIAERAFLDKLDSFSPSSYQGLPWTGRPPLAAFMQKHQDATWSFDGLLARPDGAKVLRECVPLEGGITAAEAATIGRELAEDLLQRAGDNFFDQ